MNIGRRPNSNALSWRRKFQVYGLLSLNLWGALTWSEGLERFHFDYAIYGFGQPQDLQVFDDGARTYLLCNEAHGVPRVQSSQGKEPLRLSQEGAYWVIQGVHSHLILRFGQGLFHVLSTGLGEIGPEVLAQVQADLKVQRPAHWHEILQTSSRAPKDLNEQAQAQAHESFVSNSYATPLSGDVLSWKESSMGGDAQRASALDNSPVMHAKPEPNETLTVPFTLGSQALSAKAKERIKAFLKHQKPEFDFTVIGYEDESYVEGLGRARAQIILKYLVSQGVSPEQVQLQMEPLTELKPQGVHSELAAKIIRHKGSAQLLSKEDPVKAGLKERSTAKVRQQPESTQAHSSALSTEAEAREGETLPKPANLTRVIKSGELIHEGLARFAQSHHWTLLWQVNWDWRAVAQIDLSKDSDPVNAVGRVIQALRQEGHALELRAYEDNQVMEVLSSEVLSD